MKIHSLKRFSALRLVVFVALMGISISAIAQQTLGSINGTVLDPAGAAIPDATVTVTNSAIDFTRSAKSQGDGFFQIFNLPIGTYTVKISHDGFETTELTGIGVQEARATTVNGTLKLGQVSNTVEVTGNPMLNATDTTNGYTLDSTQIEQTPLATGSFTQLATLSTGVSAELLSNLDSNAGLGNQPIWANGQRDTSNTFQVNGVDSTNIFNGKSSSGSPSQRYNFGVGETDPVGGENGTGTSVYESNGNSLPSPPPEFLQELRVNTSMYDAQQGATAGAQIDVNTATGTNNWHGQVYGTFANNSLNASPFFFNQEAQLSQEGVGAFPSYLANPALHRWTTGGTFGGPIKKDKLFFFLAYQHGNFSDQATGISQTTVPFGLTNDRSTSGINNALLSWCYNPQTASYSCSALPSIDPVASALLNAKLPNGQFMIPSAQNSNYIGYGVPNVTLVGTSTLITDQATASLDYAVSKADQLSFKYYYQNDPVHKPYGLAATGGFPLTQENGSQVGAIDNTIVLGSRINWEQRLGFVRMLSYSYNDQTVLPDATLGPTFGIGSGDSTGLILSKQMPGLLIDQMATSNLGTSGPSMALGPYSSESTTVNAGYYQNRINPSSNVIFSLGKHTLIAGGGYSYTQLNIENNRNGMLNVTAKDFNGFLQGESYKSNILDSTVAGSNRNNMDRYYRSNELAFYLQDKWQVQPNLSITAGVRYDYHGGLTEKYGNMFTFNPSLYDVTGTSDEGFKVLNSGFVVAPNNHFAGSVAKSNLAGSDSTLTGRQWGISPRVGFAWSPKQNQGRIVFSGGAGIYFDRGELFSYLSQPYGSSGGGGVFGVTQAVPLVTLVSGAGETLEDPLGTPSYVAPSADPSYFGQALQAQLDNMTGNDEYVLSGGAVQPLGKKCGAIDNQENYQACTPTIDFGSYNPSNVLPYTINYTLKMQWQPRPDLSFDLGYVGNRGRHSVIPIPFNEPGLATAQNPIWGETASYGWQVLNANSVATINTPYGYQNYDYNSIAGEPWNTASGGNIDFRTPYVGYNFNSALFKTVGVSAYDALQAHLEKRLSHNFQAGVSYTWSHALDEQSDLGIFFTGDNPNRLRDSWASADFDRTHIFSANFQAALPNWSKPRSALSFVTNDWNLTGVAILQSGQPYSLYEFYGASGSIFVGNYPNLMNPILGVKNPSNPKSMQTGNKGSFRGAGGDYIPALDPSQVAINYLSPGQDGIPVSTGNDPQDIYETDFAPSDQRNIFRQSPQKRLDVSFRKSLKITERYNLQYAFNIFNVTNTTSLDVPMNQTQIAQSYACSTAAQNGLGGYNNCTNYYLNYGQVATTNGTADQASAQQALFQVPHVNGSGRSTTVPATINGSPNNGANFGSVLGVIGGARSVTMALHFTF
ncbi:carboxypeptidase regulatory-like domain-containing protein [Acidicapsa dinghuensis]|uniref:Carboxypeptidase regulatory-like domain-containing protein n=1 Tax=Acidicapsa dinghuensis TaxID=2218256 RepID=A0ABW1EJQ6_9BACT|nr:carboxypeptidase regulatory-like domain-containing protein [Acidicapsa dinghuensis]